MSNVIPNQNPNLYLICGLMPRNRHGNKKHPDTVISPLVGWEVSDEDYTVRPLGLEGHYEYQSSTLDFKVFGVVDVVKGLVWFPNGDSILRQDFPNYALQRWRENFED